MRGALPALLALAASSAFAQFPPPQGYAGDAPCTRAFTLHFPPDAPTGGMCLQWYCPEGDDWEAVGFCLNYEDIQPDTETGSISNLWLKPMTRGQRDALWAKQITRELTPVERSMWNELLGNKPLSVYAVPAYRDELDRPTYPLVSGVRATKSNGRIRIGAPCFPSVWSSASYAAITTSQPISVAVCVKR